MMHNDGTSRLLSMLRAAPGAEQVACIYLPDGHGDGLTLTRDELDRRARALAARLMRAAPRGERALLLLPTGLDFPVAFLGCLYAGLIAVPVYPPDARRLDKTLSQVSLIARDARPCLALVTSASLPILEPFRERLGLGEGALIAVDTIDPAGAADYRDQGVDGSATAFLQYTSGSTGDPKGVIVSHDNLAHNLEMQVEMYEVIPGATVVTWLPLYHDLGLIGGLLLPLSVGGRCVMMSPFAFLTRPWCWLHAISRFRATTTVSPTFALDLCVRKTTAEQRAGLDLSSWTGAVNGAEPIRPEVLDRFVEAFGPHGFRRETLLPGYGLAEATVAVSVGRVEKGRGPVMRWFDSDALDAGIVKLATPGDPGARRHVASGAPASGNRVLIADPESLRTCPPGRVGEILVGGGSVAQGYWGRPEETAATFQVYLQDTGEGPLLRTGDLGFMMDGGLYVTGRIKDLIIIAGSNHYPQDLERAAEESHPWVRPGGCAAFAVEGRETELVVIAAEVEPRPATTELPSEALGLSAVERAIRHAVANQCGVDVHEVVLLRPHTIPKTTSGKIQRRTCKARLLAGTLEVIHA